MTMKTMISASSELRLKALQENAARDRVQRRSAQSLQLKEDRTVGLGISWRQTAGGIGLYWQELFSRS